LPAFLADGKGAFSLSPLFPGATPGSSSIRLLIQVSFSGRFAPSSSESMDKPRSSTGRRVTALDPINETPTKDLRDVSTFLKRPFSPITSTPNQSPRALDAITPSSLPPLPPSPSKSIIDHLPKVGDVKAAVQQFQPQEVLQNGNELLIALRTVSTGNNFSLMFETSCLAVLVEFSKHLVISGSV
jgi:hypothetical protein